MISETTIDRERIENPIILYGNCPIIITIPHDGDLKEFDGTHLAFVPENKRRDLHTKEIGLALRKEMEETYGLRPTLVIQQIHRRFMTQQIEGSFQNAVEESVANVTRQFSDVLLFDLHGFAERPVTLHFAASSTPKNVDFGIILGTHHRRSIRNNEDVELAKSLRLSGFTTYLPASHAIEGEIFTAEPPHTVLQTIRRMNTNRNVSAMQVEIGSRYRNGEGINKIGKALGRFAGQWAAKRTQHSS